MVTRIAVDHPDDYAHRVETIHAMHDTRARHGVSRAALAVHLDIGVPAIDALEYPRRRQPPNPLVATVQRHIRAVGELAGVPLSVLIDLPGVPDLDPDVDSPDDVVEAAMWQAIADGGGSAYADSAAVSVVMVRLRAIRRRIDPSGAVAAEAMSVTRSGLHRIERCEAPSQMATLQRHARYDGGLCRLRIVEG